MAEKNRNVKCKECGRTLPGPPRDCDVCGTRMTYREAEIYRTPEGSVSRRVNSEVFETSSQSPNHNEPVEEPEDSGINFTKVKSMINSVVIGEEDNLLDDIEQEINLNNQEENVKEAAQTIKLLNPKVEDASFDNEDKSYDFDDESDDDDESSYKNPLEIIGSIVGIIIAVVVFGTGFFGDDAETYNTYVNEIRVTDNYKIYVNDVMHDYIDEGDSTITIDFKVNTMNAETVTFNLDNDFKVIIDDGIYDISEIYMSDDEGRSYDESEEYTLKPGITYFFEIVYDYDTSEWYDVLIKHNLGGGLDSRDISKDILIQQDNY